MAIRSAAERTANLENYAPLVDQIKKSAEEGFFEGIMYDIGGSLFYGLGKSFVDDMRESNQAERDAIVDEHLEAIANGATPQVDDKGNYTGFRNIVGEDDLITSKKWDQLLPGGDTDLGLDDFLTRYNAQKAASELDPYGASTATGFVVNNPFSADLNGDGETQEFVAGGSYSVNSNGSVVLKGGDTDETGGSKFFRRKSE